MTTLTAVVSTQLEQQLPLIQYYSAAKYYFSFGSK